MDISANIYLTWNCNFKCAHCEHSCDSMGEHMPIENFDIAWERIEWMTRNPAIDLRVLGITGGEPTLHPNFWDMLMPKLAWLRNTNPGTPIELHTNGSIPVPETEFKNKYNKIFAKVIVGRDIFHEQFRDLKHLFLDDYEFFAQEVCLRKNAYIATNGILYSSIRKKGRGAEIKFPSRNPYKDCKCFMGSNYRIFSVNFTPKYVTFCGENAAKSVVIDNKIAVGYDASPEDLIQRCCAYNQLYSGVRCQNPCISDIVCETDFI